MPEPNLSKLFRTQDVQAVADRLGDGRWHALQHPSFRKAMEDLDRNRIGGEANTREKIIEPILYDALGFSRDENDAEHAIHHAGAGGATGAVEYFFRLDATSVPVEAKAWKRSLDKKDSSGRSPVRQGLDYAVLSNLRWFVITNGAEWRLYKTQLKGSQSPLNACERYDLSEISEDRRAFLRFCATFERAAFVPDRQGVSRLDELRQKDEGWENEIGKSLYDRLVESRVRLYRAIQSRLPRAPQDEVNDAVVKLLFRVMFILFAEHTPLLPKEFLSREVLNRFENDRKWGGATSLYQYIQRYFAWLDGRDANDFDVFPYDGALFDRDPILDDEDLRLDDELLKDILNRLSREAMGRSIDYSQINPRTLGNIYEKFLGFVIEVKEGRLDPQVERDTRRKEGSVYTPEPVTKCLVEHCVSQALQAGSGRQPWELKCLDPACGSGHFLVEYVNHVARLCEERDDSRSYPHWKRYITEHCVFGVDKDRTAVMLTKLSLWINSAMEKEPFAVIDTHVKCGNSLVSGVPAGFRLAAFEKREYPAKFRDLRRLRKELASVEQRADTKRPLLGVADSLELHRRMRQAVHKVDEAKAPVAKRFTEELAERWPSLAGVTPFHWEIDFAEIFEEQDGFDIIVGNPPWGADLRDIHDYLEGGSFELARGQYDSYELFIELGRRLLHERGVLGFIIPDSITLPEHEPLRRDLVNGSALTQLVRAGEGLFPGVYRAAFLLCFLNRSAPSEHVVRVATLRKADWRLLEEDTLFAPVQTMQGIIDGAAGHEVAQDHFQSNARCEFDILAQDVDASVIRKIDSCCVPWPSFTTKGRGVEIGKSGEVVQCPFCYRWDNVPRKTKGKWRPKICRHCQREYVVERAARYEVIIRDKPKGKGWRSIIPGESVNRYSLGPRQYIDTSKDGINYKDDHFYKGKRLLLRQTGVGIYATIDDSGALTNQSVFTWKLRDDSTSESAGYRLEYVLGVLSSRTMLYRYYMKSGDTEWRSFPRWTQELVQELPVRNIDFSDARQRRLHDEIAERVARVIESGKPPTDHDDYQIEKAVMQLYGITKSMCRRIFDVLHEVQRLRVIREMNIAQPDELVDALAE